MQIRLTPYGMDAWTRGLQQAPEMAQREMLAAVAEAVNLLESDVTGRYPVASGLTRQDIKGDYFSTPAGVLGVVGIASPVGAFVELGTRPHWAPIAPLVHWVETVLGITGVETFGIAKAIQRKIAREGTKARPLFAEALARHEAAMVRMFEDAAGRIAQHLAQPPGAPA